VSGSDDIGRLVGTVQRLPREDQQRILRLVELLSRAPAGAQRKTQQRLRELVGSDPDSHSLCIARVDELIEDLERSVATRGSTRNVARRSPLRGRDGRFGRFGLGMTGGKTDA
jgi:hypothetical protein